ncbi:uncharacterized protein TNCV_468611 [Trichonephila clavipes]|nr:uncharacterized protein TNCV_468611 [Trichonephila clavipes]
MNLATPSQRFNKKESGLDTAVETVATVSMQIAAKEAKDGSGHSDITIAIDGTWKKNGHTSLNGPVFATSFYTGKVLDAAILSRICKFPKKMHNKNCKTNHFGNSGSKEVPGAIEFFQRSESLHSLRYTKFLGNGDARAYKAVNEMQPYGDTGIEKMECVGYVKKWMGTRLRALKLKMKRKKLSDKKHWMITVDLQTLKLINYSVIMDWLSETIPIVLIVLIQCTDSINSMKRTIWAHIFIKHRLMHIHYMVCAQQTKIPCVNITEQLQQIKNIYENRIRRYLQG